MFRTIIIFTTVILLTCSCVSVNDAVIKSYESYHGLIGEEFIRNLDELEYSDAQKNIFKQIHEAAKKDVFDEYRK